MSRMKTGATWGQFAVRTTWAVILAEERLKAVHFQYQCNFDE